MRGNILLIPSNVGKNGREKEQRRPDHLFTEQLLGLRPCVNLASQHLLFLTQKSRHPLSGALNQAVTDKPGFELAPVLVDATLHAFVVSDTCQSSSKS